VAILVPVKLLSVPRFFVFSLGILALSLNFGLGISPELVSAQELGVAQYFAIAGEVPNGSIISSRNSLYQLSSEPYDKSMIGVATDQPAIEMRSNQDISGKYPVLSQGMVNVRVNTENGPIKSGDTITSSSVPGVGMRSMKTGFILGVSQGEFSGEGEGLVLVALNIKLAFADDSPTSERIGSQLLDVIKLSSIGVLEDPVSTLRYVLAAAVMIASFAVSVFTAAKVARGGVDAVARNPLAKHSIMTSVVLNVLLSIGMLGLGVLAAYIIIDL